MKLLTGYLIAAAMWSPLLAPAQSTDFNSAYGPRFKGRQLNAPAPKARPVDPVHRWNQVALDATGLDHTPVQPGENRVFGEQLGPGRASRAMAIVHIAIADAVSAITHAFQSYTGVQSSNAPVSMNAAIAQAAHDALVAMYPSQSQTFDADLVTDLAVVRNQRAKNNGIALGQQIASTLLALRSGDGSEVPEPLLGVDYFTSDQPGHWRQDPIGQQPVALGAHWGECKPFVTESGSQFRAPAPPLMTSADYTAAYNEVKNVGGDGVVTPTSRTAEQTFIGIFWAYDGTPSLCAPPRLYNQITVQLADQKHLNIVDLARLLALMNTAMADTGMAVWESKYYWDFWRPVAGIRESDPGSGPTGLGDGNDDTIGDLNFTPLGAPASNLTGPNFTPPFPAYPSGHAGFGGAIFETLRRFFGTDAITFTFVSDEFNGITKDNQGNVRPYIPRTFTALSQAEEENGQSRIYLGIHWSFDKTAGIAQGQQIADYVFDHAFTATHR